MASHSSGAFEVVLTLVMGTLLLAYLLAAHLQKRRGRRWSRTRCLLFTVGAGLVVFALSPTVVHFAHHDLRGHMLQHLLLGMVAPLGLVLAAPLSLMLRSLPVRWARWTAGVFSSRLVCLLSHPISALTLNFGVMAVLYMTPLYQLSLSNSFVHGWVHLHFLLVGCLFTWAIAGPDPGRKRPSLNFRLFVLFLSMAGHAILSKCMYAYGWPQGTHHTLEEIRAAAQWMYYGGDFSELLLLLALFNTWLRSRPAHALQPATAWPGNVGSRP